MSHWRINGVPCCLSKWTGSELVLLGVTTSFTCACSRKGYESMVQELQELYPEEDFLCTFHEDSCPGESFLKDELKTQRIKAINQWVPDECGWSVDAELSTNEIFVLTASFTPQRVYLIEVPERGWTYLSDVNWDAPDLSKIQARE